MNNPRFDYIAENLPRLGFGLMRMPVCDDGTVDTKQVKQMADLYMKTGMNYFDTAYMYHNGESEKVFKAAVAERYPREAFRVADKMPIWECKEAGDIEKIFATQLERTGLTYFDYYLLHALDGDRHIRVAELGGYDFMKKLKAQGKARHIGFSFHGEPDALRAILQDQPELEFVQLQINYYDWDAIHAGELHQIAMEFGVPVILMEPVRGGMLAKLPQKAVELLKASRPTDSPAAWAMRYGGSLEGVMTVLSGMSSLEQMMDNINTMKDFQPISEQEGVLLNQVLEIIKATPNIACTACRYCADCPQNIPIFDIFTQYNQYLEKRNLGDFLREYGKINASSRADACVDCGLCSSVCPQHLEIPALLEQVAELAR